MDITKNELQAVIKTLPIGLYLKRGLSVTVGDSDTSYYSPPTDEIVISFPQIQTALAKVVDKSESVIRGVLYHEVSHAFMTPKDMNWNDVVNVFEDERMETILSNYYHDVDFKSNVYLINGLDYGVVPPATDKFTAFYNLVRFRSGTPKMLKRVEKIIADYAHYNRNTDQWESHSYYRAIMNLYGDMTEPEAPKEGGNQQFQGDVTQGDGDKPIEGSAEGSEGTDSNDVQEGGQPCKGASSKPPLTEKEIKAMIANIVSDKNTGNLITTFQTILDSFSKKNKGGSSIGGYSGVLNPRSANREDFKIFDRPFTQKANNQFGTCHLNLFIDCSGSFYGSQELVNQLLAALSLIEKRNPNFTLDVVFCGRGERVAQSPRERVLNCSGGNDLDNNIYDIYRSLQKPSTFNYNIVLFDGDAFSDCYSGSDHRKNFRAFDFNNCTIITDEQNRKHITKRVSKAKVIYTNKYTEELITNIINTLTRAFR